MKIRMFFLACLCLHAILISAQPTGNKRVGAKGEIRRAQTFCNPLDLPYRFQLEGNQREAADPVIVLYKNMYWLFASKSGGYWQSPDMVHWKLIEPEGLPLEQYAPAVAEVNGKLYYLAGNGVFTTDDPAKGKWTQAAKLIHGVDDPALFVDDDNRLYLYHGCKENKPIKAVELDTHSFQPVGSELDVIFPDYKTRGWEVAGDFNRGKNTKDTVLKNFLPWIEGSWMNKINGKYYLQYAAPGTQFQSYADGVFVSDSPVGPFVYAPYSPFSYKPAGFVTGVGHSATFPDKSNQLWHVTTVTLSVRHVFERRLALFPTAVLKDGQLVTNTYLGDYPQYAPGVIKNPVLGNTAGWMLVSFHKPATASSTLVKDGNNFRVENAFDEQIKTWWSAATGNAGEWLQVDLTKKCRIDAIQINFADQGATAFGRLRNDGYRYFVETSDDAKVWKTIIDRKDSARDEPHHYVQLEHAVTARYVRITNAQSPAGSNFSIYDLRVFGSGLGKKPDVTGKLMVERNKADLRRVHLSWEPVKNADFYIVRFGIAPDRLFSNYQVYNSNEVDINSLNANVDYFFTVDAVNDSGISLGEKVSKAN